MSKCFYENYNVFFSNTNFNLQDSKKILLKNSKWKDEICIRFPGISPIPVVFNLKVSA